MALRRRWSGWRNSIGIQKLSNSRPQPQQASLVPSSPYSPGTVFQKKWSATTGPNTPHKNSVTLQRSIYGFRHITSSPHFPQSSGHAEWAVQTAKKLLEGSKDPYMSLLSYRSTPLPWCGYSHAELLMGRRWSNLPQTLHSLTPQWSYLDTFRDLNDEVKEKQKEDYDIGHGTRPLPDIPTDTTVWVATNHNCTTGCVLGPASTPTSYLIDTDSGQIGREREMWCNL